jgi:hydrogenase expression/formation protein HypC
MSEQFTSSAYCTLDHDGCIVCSDAGIPLRVVSIDGDDALCEDTVGNRTEIAIELIKPVAVGEVLLTHGGVALSKIEKADKLKC